MPNRLNDAQKPAAELPRELGQYLLAQGVDLCRFHDVVLAAKGHGVRREVIHPNGSGSAAQIAAQDVLEYLQKERPGTYRFAGTVDIVYENLVTQGYVKASVCQEQRVHILR